MIRSYKITMKWTMVFYICSNLLYKKLTKTSMIIFISALLLLITMNNVEAFPTPGAYVCVGASPPCKICPTGDDCGLSNARNMCGLRGWGTSVNTVNDPENYLDCDAAPSITGKCGLDSGTCDDGISISDDGATSCGTTRNWTCQGSGGGDDTPCTYTNSPCPIPGLCGSANGVPSYSAPTSGLCSSIGPVTPVTGSGPWSWDCNGLYTGTPDHCSAPLKQDGICGSSNGQGFNTAPSSDLCNPGAASTVTGSGPWFWTCVGSGGGSTDSCSAVKKIDGICGTAQGKASATAPTTNLCSVGSYYNFTSTSTAWNWSCSASSGGTPATCSAPRIVNGACGTADGFATTVTPSVNLCVSGSAAAVTGTGPWAWSCTGANGCITKPCAAPLLMTPSFGGTCPI